MLWKDTVLEVINKYVPRKKDIINKNTPLIDSELIHASKKKKTAKRKVMCTGKEIDWNNKRINNQVKALSMRKYNDYINKTCVNISNNPKGFWKPFNYKNLKKLNS